VGTQTRFIVIFILAFVGHLSVWIVSLWYAKQIRITSRPLSVIFLFGLFPFDTVKNNPNYREVAFVHTAIDCRVGLDFSNRCRRLCDNRHITNSYPSWSQSPYPPSVCNGYRQTWLYCCRAQYPSWRGRQLLVYWDGPGVKGLHQLLREFSVLVHLGIYKIQDARRVLIIMRNLCLK